MQTQRKPAEAIAKFLVKKKHRSLFITGTDTNVGKTFITAQLVQRLLESKKKVVAIKPISCGRCGRKDAIKYWELAEKKISLQQINPYFFRSPLAPFAQRSKQRVLPGKIRNLFQNLRKNHDVVLVEGIGGFLVPITRTMSVRDIASTLGAPLLIVAHAGLGTLNHTILTVEAARHAGLKVAAVVLNDREGYRMKTAIRNQRVLEKILKLPVFIEPPFKVEPK